MECDTKEVPSFSCKYSKFAPVDTEHQASKERLPLVSFVASEVLSVFTVRWFANHQNMAGTSVIGGDTST